MIEPHSLLDIHFADFLTGRTGFEGEGRERFRYLILALSSAMASGHSCLPVTPEDSKFLLSTDLVSRGEQSPLVIFNDMLYLHRYFNYETRLARQMSTLATKVTHIELRNDFPKERETGNDSETDWQQEAVKVALTQSLTIISGGPGTGKTTTVVKIIAMLLQQVGSELKIALAAPTGKAAMRLRESIVKSIETMALSAGIKKAMPVDAKTLHRLLGVRRNSPQFRHNHENPMDWDVVVVDEASMVDLALMSKLVDGLKQGARLILLGDKDQLASVESGAVLVDLIASLPANTVELQKTYRFDSSIKRLAESINKGDSTSAWSLLQDPSKENISLLEGDLIPYVGMRYAEYMQVAVDTGEQGLKDLFQLFNGFQILCGVHFGRMGVEGMNHSVELSLARRGYDCRHDNWYTGRPVLVTRNDYGLDLYNGDIGICLPDEKDGGFKVWFERGDGGMRAYSPHRLPRCETVFAMTVHKSQGSEFDEVIVVLPEEDNKILSRELIYTAVTRARKSVNIVAKLDIFRGALSHNIERFSGLAGQLDKNLTASGNQ